MSGPGNDAASAGRAGTLPADSRPWVVLKFGGTSVARAERWDRIASHVRSLLPERRVWIVVSALAGVSNDLLRAIDEARSGRPLDSLRTIRDAHRALADGLRLGEPEYAPVGELLDRLESWLTGIGLTGEAPPRLVARILAVGELASSRLGQAALAGRGVPAAWVDARGLLESKPGERPDEHRDYLEATVLPRSDPGAAEATASGVAAVITQGFIAATPEGETCLLGRGGSDTSGALFAALLAASRLEIWTDVPGLFTADPRIVPTARLIRRLGYREAQELAAMGARVLHPRCLAPVEAFGIPLSVRSIADPDEPGTRVEATGEAHPAVTAVTCRTGVTLLSLSTLEMWREPGFLARMFAPFDELGVSVDLVATSQAAITLTLDEVSGGTRGPTFERLLRRLERLSRVKVVHPCAVVSIVGRRIRAALPEIGAALSAFHERPVHLVSDSAEDLNLSFVVEERDARPLVVRLHEQLFAVQGGAARLGPTWELLEGRSAAAPRARPWWHAERERLLALAADGLPRYVYHLPTIRARARSIRGALPSVDRLYYSMKANAHARILELLAAEGLGIECVSAAEVLRAREVVGGEVPLLFTPNFCPLEEYAAAAEAGAEIVIDGPEPLQAAPALFSGLGVGLRIDPGHGLGHHDKVRTAGPQVKFGCALSDVDTLHRAISTAGVRIVGLHAHVGSGILDPGVWAGTGRTLLGLLRGFGDVRWIDLGGGLGVPERPGQPGLDLDALERDLRALAGDLGGIELRLEPGRYLVGEAGVLLSGVTQVRRKASVRFVGLATGMNSLIRPALYGAWHGIHNLSRLDQPPDDYWHVVGPICESSDVLGRDRLLPATRPGDVMLIEQAGAYGAVMASAYNLRAPAEEIVLDA